MDSQHQYKMSFPDLVLEAAHWNWPHLMVGFAEEFVVVASYEHSQNRKGLRHGVAHYRVRERKQSYPLHRPFMRICDAKGSHLA